MNKGTVIQLIATAVGIFALLKALEGFGIYESPGTKRKAAKWRNLPELSPSYYKEVLGVKNVMEAANLLYDTSDQGRLNDVKTAIAGIYNAKGVLIDDEEKAVKFIKANVRAKIELSIFADLYKNLPVLAAAPVSIGVVPITITSEQPTYKDLAEYLDSFLENRFQADLFKWFKSLPFATEKQEKIYKSRTGKTLKPL